MEAKKVSMYIYMPQSENSTATGRHVFKIYSTKYKRPKETELQLLKPRPLRLPYLELPASSPRDSEGSSSVTGTEVSVSVSSRSTVGDARSNSIRVTSLSVGRVT